MANDYRGNVDAGDAVEHVVLHKKAKLYRFDVEGNQWKERCVGHLRLLMNEETGNFRLVMRQRETRKICADFLIVPSITLQEHATNEEACVLHAEDFSDGEVKDGLFSIRFASVESCREFREMVEEIVECAKNESSSANAAGSVDENKAEESEEVDA